MILRSPISRFSSPIASPIGAAPFVPQTGVTPIAVSTILAASGSAADSINYATAPLTVLANQLALFAAISCKTGGPEDPSIGGSVGGTWTKVDEQTIDADRTLRVYRSLQGTERTGTLQLNHVTTHESAMWVVVGCTGIALGGTNGSAAIVQARKNAVTAVSALAVTMDPFGSGDNVGLAFCGRDVNAAITAVAPYTQVSQAGITPLAARIQAASALGSNAPSWTFGVCDAAGIAVEVQIA